jgi:hypothetical protein
MMQASDYRRALLNPRYDESQPILEPQRVPLSFANPYGARISEYEQVLLYNQPNPDWIAGGLGVGGWSTSFPGGRGTWENYFTEARTSDWFVFRDPEGRWQRPYVAEKADQWRDFQRAVSTSASQKLHRGLNGDWASRVLSGHLGALGLHDYGVFMSLAAPIRDCLVDTLRAAIVSSSLDYLDNAQMIQAEKLYLAQVTTTVSAEMAPSKALWHGDGAWRGARTLVERLWGDSYDHIESLFAIHMIHEPLFGRFVREEFFTRQAAALGDLFTPRVQWYAIRSADLASRWAIELFGRTLAGDPAFGDYNKRLMRYWAETWLPLEIAALQDAWQLWSAGGAVEGSPARRAAEQGLRDIVEDWRIKYAALFDLDISVDSVTSGVGGGGAVA